MEQTKLLRRIGAARRGRFVELTCIVEAGATVTFLASLDQVDRLVDELEDVLNAPEESETDDDR